MWPFQKKQKSVNDDPYWDYLDVDTFLCGANIPSLTSNEFSVVKRGLAEFKGQRLHPEIASDTFGAFSAGALTAYALQSVRQHGSLDVSISALQKAMLIYPHPLVALHLADVLNATGRTQEAQEAYKEAAQMQKNRTPKATDSALTVQIEAENNLKDLFANISCSH